MERILRGVAGGMVLLSIALTVFVHPNWIWLTVFIGINLLQSSFSNWCPMMAILRKVGIN